MTTILSAALFGLFGGVVRAIIGFLKHRKEGFKAEKFGLTLVLSGIIGAFSALLLVDDLRLVLLAGYAGTDLIEGMYKLFKK